MNTQILIMSIELRPIETSDYEKEKNRMLSLSEKIWTRSESLDEIKTSIERWVSEEETGKYFYIIQDGEEIGLTGYYIPERENGLFGLRHHGTIVKGTGKAALDALINYLRDEYGSSFKLLIEFIPEGREELIDIFKRWRFKLIDIEVPEWQPRREYYKYVMIREMDSIS